MFMFSAGMHIFDLKTTLHSKADLKNEFLGQIYHVNGFSGQKVEYLQRTLTWTCCIPADPENQTELVPGPDHDQK